MNEPNENLIKKFENDNQDFILCTAVDIVRYVCFIKTLIFF